MNEVTDESSSRRTNKQTERAMSGWRGRALRGLSSPKAPWLLGILGLSLALPSLWGGLALDDHFLALFARGGGPLGERAAWDWFAWTEAGGEEARAMGLFPWWSPPGAQLRPWRPLASLTHALDFALWPGSPWVMHLHNLLWGAALLVVVGRLYRRLQGSPEAASLALGLYALDDARGMGLGWISGRHAILGALGAAASLWAHARWRQEGWAPGAWLSALCLALGALASESALGVVPYVLAWAAVMEPGRGRAARSWGVIPALSVSVGHEALVWWLGYGAPGTRLVLSPWWEPLAWTREAPSRLAALIFGQWGLVPSDLWVLVPPGGGHGALMALAAVFALWIGAALWPLLKENPAARMWALGSLGALVGLCGEFPSDRRLFVSGLGAMAVLSLSLVGLARGGAWVPTSGGARRRVAALAAGWWLVHGVAAPLLSPLRALSPALLDGSFTRLARWLPAQGLGARDALVVARAPDAWSASATPALRAAMGLEGPGSAHALCGGAGALRLRRVDAQTLEVEIDGGALGSPVEAGFLGPGGARVEGASLPALEVEVVGWAGERPTRLRVRSRGALEDAPLRWVAWTGAGYVWLTLPAPGEALTLEAVDPVAAFVGPAEGR
jgi:hypothetical protein